MKQIVYKITVMTGGGDGDFSTRFLIIDATIRLDSNLRMRIIDLTLKYTFFDLTRHQDQL